MEKILIVTGEQIEQSVFQSELNRQDIADMNVILEQHTKDLEQLLYVPISINSFNISRSVAERGESLLVSLTWVLNKEPISQTLDGASLQTSIRNYNYPSELTTNKSFNLVVNDGKTTANRSVGISFYNGKYYGVSSNTVYDNDFIKSLSKNLTDSRAGSFNVTCGAGEYIFFVIPSRFGLPSFTVGGFTGGFSKVSTIAFTNNFNYTENYDIWKSTNSNLGSTTVNVG